MEYAPSFSLPILDKDIYGIIHRSENIEFQRGFLLNNHITMRTNHLMWSFLFSKFLYLLNAFGQLYLLNFFLGNDYHMYGFAVIRALFTGNNENWTVTPRFPRVTWYV